jgi:AdoMet-dependent heme synthase
METKEKKYRLSSLYLYLTDNCNLNCQHCWITPNFSDTEKIKSIDPFFLEKAISESLDLGLARVKLTGGEPFIRKDILDIIDIVRKYPVLLDVETNGTLINEKIASSLANCKTGTLSVSLDSPDEKTHDAFRGKKGAFSNTINGMKILKRYGIGFQVICSVYRDNLKDLSELIKLVKDLGASSFKFNPLSPAGRALDIYDKGSSLTIEETIKLKDEMTDSTKNKYGIPVYISIPIAFYSFEEIQNRNHGLCHILNILGILSDGSISFCGIGKTENDLIMGNVKNESIPKVWETHPILLKMRREIPNKLSGICGKCIFKSICLGKCIAITYSLNKSFTSGYWFCEEAYSKGLFPKTRLIDND